MPTPWKSLSVSRHHQKCLVTMAVGSPVTQTLTVCFRFKQQAGRLSPLFHWNVRWENKSSHCLCPSSDGITWQSVDFLHTLTVIMCHPAARMRGTEQFSWRCGGEKVKLSLILKFCWWKSVKGRWHLQRIGSGSNTFYFNIFYSFDSFSVFGCFSNEHWRNRTDNLPTCLKLAWDTRPQYFLTYDKGASIIPHVLSNRLVETPPKVFSRTYLWWRTSACDQNHTFNQLVTLMEASC